MGAHKCEFGVVHKVCRCPESHTIKCDKAAEHAFASPGPDHNKISPTHAPCYRLSTGKIGKHEAHESHVFYYTSSGGGHYLDKYDEAEKNVRAWICPGRK